MLIIYIYIFLVIFVKRVMCVVLYEYLKGGFFKMIVGYKYTNNILPFAVLK